MTPDLLAFIAQTLSALIAATAAVYAARRASAARTAASEASAGGPSEEFETAVLSRLDQLNRAQMRQGRMLTEHLTAHASGDFAQSI